LSCCTSGKSGQKTVLFVTHSISESVLLADRVLVMTARPGRLALEVTIDLPRPRSARMRTLPRFGEIVASLQEAMGIMT
jgi:NitT/TauT family transport system ATP-binding protein